MKYIWAVILLFFLLIAGVLGYKYFSTDFKYQASASVVIQSPRDEVYRHIAVIDNWLKWSQFNTKNSPDILAEGQAEGRHLVWTDPRGGKGKLFLGHIDAASRSVEFQVVTEAFPPMNGKVEVLAAGSPENPSKHPKVHFSAKGQLPKSVFYAVAINGYGQMLGGQFQKGLDRLKQQLEKTEANAKDGSSQEAGAAQPPSSPKPSSSQ